MTNYRKKQKSKFQNVLSKIASCGLAMGMAVTPSVTSVSAIEQNFASISNSGYKVTSNHTLTNPLTGQTFNPGYTDDTGNISINGQTVFCVDAGTLANSKIPLLKYSGYSGFKDIGYSEAEVDLMQQIATVGYNMDQSPAMRAATQIRIWQVHYPNGYSNIPAEVQAKIDEINSRLKVFQQTTNFQLKSGNGSISGNNIQLSGYGEENAVTLTDTNGVFNAYVQNENSSYGSGVHLEKSGNDLKLWVDKSGNSDGRLVYNTYYLTEKATAPIVYVSKQNQSMGCFGNADPLRLSLTYSVDSDVKSTSLSSTKSGEGNIQLKVNITKTDSDSGKGIEGVDFDIYRQELDDEGNTTEVLIGSATTDKNGKINTTIDQKESFTSAKYTENYLLNTDELSEEQLNVALGKGWFKTKNEAQASADAKSSNDLNRRISNYQAQKYSYVIKETKTGTGYYLDATKSSWKSEEVTGSGTISFSVKNNVVKGQLTIIKEGETLTEAKTTTKDGETTTEFTYSKNGLYGAEYDIIANEDIKDAADGSVKYKKGTVVQHVVTVTDGSTVCDALPLGKYLIKETKAPYGYVLNDEGQEVELKYASQSVSLVTNSVSFTNERTKLKINVNKESASTKNKLKGAQFGLYAAENVYKFDSENYVVVSNGGTVDNDENILVAKDALIETATTGEDGTVQFSSNLPLGKYYVKEIKAPKGYKLSNEKIEINATYKDGKSSSVVVEKTMEDEFDDITVKVNKVDENGKAITGKDFEFTLYEDDCSTKIETVKGDEKTGTATFEDLDIGKYCIKETKQPEGYTLSNEATKVSVEEYGKVYFNGEEVNPDEGQTIVYSLNFTNKEEVHTGLQTGTGKLVVMGAASGVALIAVTGLALRNKRKD